MISGPSGALPTPKESRPPLAGLTVVAVEQAVAAPLATRHLADLGARVIKVERPGTGDFARHYDNTVLGMSSHFVWLNRSKQSVALDLKSHSGLRAVKTLVSRADVFVQNLAPGSADRLGLGADELRAARPELIHCSISGYGDGGPYSDKKAYDLLIQCETGLLSCTGTPEHPCKVGISVADIATGMYAYTGILTALLRRAQSGCGATLAISMLEALGEWMGFPMYYAAYGGTPPQRTGASHASIAPYGPYPAADGHVFLGVQNDREWLALCSQVLGSPQLGAEPRFATLALRAVNRTELDNAIARVTRDIPASDLTRRLDQAGIANARMRDVQGFFDHEQLAARNRWRDVDTEKGPVKALLPPAILDEQNAVMGAVPAVGEHTVAILRELGISDE